ncbi:hypothetical protein M8J75_007156 [Diaphorina citri]|nr:hypothetical protein M8J75_007156 [Diaphorina citri]
MMNESEILSEYFKQSTTHNFFDQISCESNNFDSMNNEASRRSCAWIPSEQTRNLLIQVATKLNSPSHHTEEIRLTKPKIFLQQSALEDTLAKYVKEEDRVPLLSMKHVTLDDRGLRELIQAESYLAAIELTEKMLSVYSNSNKHTLHSVQLWFTRIALLVKANFLVEAYEESKPWGNFDTPDLYLQYYPTLYGGRIGTMVPFAFRLLVAELPQFIKSSDLQDSSMLALDRLFSLLGVIKKILTHLGSNLSEDGSMIELSEQDRQESRTLWIERETRVKHSIVNCALNCKNYSLACQLLTQLLEQPRQPLSDVERAILHAALGRVLLQAGDIQSTKVHFSSSSALLNSATPSTTHSADQISALQLQHQINTGLLHVAENNFQLAYDTFDAVSKTLEGKLPGNSSLEKSYILVANNKAICLFYLGRLKASIQVLESLLKYKQCLLSRHFIANLCTMYDLYSVNVVENKLNLVNMINENKLYFNPACLASLKLQPLAM